MRHEVDYARQLFAQGLPFGDGRSPAGPQSDLFSRGGLEILNAVERRRYDVLTSRPAISEADEAGAVGMAFWRKFRRRPV